MIAMLLVGLLLAGWLPTASYAADDVTAGFDGYVRAGCWFPVRIGDQPAERITVAVVPDARYAGWEEDPTRPLAVFTGTATNAILCRLPYHHGTVSLACSWRLADGRAGHRTLRPRILQGNQNRLLVVLSAQPEAFDFLDTVRPDRHSDVRVASADPARFPSDWRALDGVDAVILDDTGADTYTPGQRAALAEWVTMGGTVFLTPDALRAAALDGDPWALYPEAACSPAPADTSWPALQALLPSLAGNLRTVPGIGLHVPPHQRLLWNDSESCLAMRPSGLGRVVAVGLDWNRLRTAERLVAESLRKALWTEFLALAPPRTECRLHTDAVVPREARARYLCVYVLGFLAVCVLAFGLVHWITQRVLRRPEAVLLSLPAASLALAAAAFGVGLTLRGRDTHVNEVEVIICRQSPLGAADGAVGVLAADRRPLTVSFVDRRGQLDGTRDAGASPLMRLAHARSPAAAAVSDAHVARRRVTPGTWAMAFFSTRRPVDIGGGLQGTAVFRDDGLACDLQSRLPFTLHGAYLLWRWNRLRLGDIPPGGRCRETLPLLSVERAPAPRCPNCGRFHGGWYSEAFCKHAPIDEPLRAVLSQLSAPHLPEGPFVAGWMEPTAPLTRIDRATPRRTVRRLVIVPLNPRAAGPSVALPFGAVKARHLSRAYRGNTDDPLGMQYGPAARAALGLPGPGDDDAADPVSGTHVEQQHHMVFDLPAATGRWEHVRLEVLWTQAATRWTRQAQPAVLSAFNWELGCWDELARSTTGTNRLVLAPPQAYIHPQAAWVAARIHAADPAAPAPFVQGSLDIAWKARSRP